MRHIAAVLGYAVLLATAEPPTQLQQPGGALAPQYGAPHGGSLTSQFGASNGGVHRTSPSTQYSSEGGYEDDDEESANYEFKYDVADQQFGVRFGHQEARQDDVVQGEYYVMLPDGRTQHVVYTADQDGYHPRITYEGGEGESRQGGYT